jgi:PAS domain S-box-containing protein
MNGYSRDELVGQSIDLLHSEQTDPEEFAASFEQLRRKGTIQLEARHRRKDGTTFPIEASMSLVTLSGRELILGIDRDITEHKRAEESLRWSEERYRKLVELAPEMVAVQSEGRIVFINALGAKLLGAASPEELIGRPAMDFVHPDYREIVRSRILQTQEGKDAGLIEEKFLRLDGQPVDVEVVATPTTCQGKPATQVFARDITERKEAEEEKARQARQATLRADAGAALAEGGTLRSILQRCTEAIVRHLGVTFARIWMLDEEESMLELQASAGMYTHIDGPHSRVPVGRFKIGLIAQERLPHLTNDVLDDPRVHDKEWAKREGMVAFAGYPLIVEDRLVGVMAMFAREPLGESTIRALASVADVIAQGTERKRVQNILIESEQRFRQLFEQSVDALIVHDEEGEIVDCNEEACRSLGYTREELLALSVRNIASGLLSEEEKREGEARRLALAAHSGRRAGHACGRSLRGAQAQGRHDFSDRGARRQRRLQRAEDDPDIGPQYYRAQEVRGGAAKKRERTYRSATDRPHRELGVQRSQGPSVLVRRDVPYLRLCSARVCPDLQGVLASDSSR